MAEEATALRQAKSFVLQLPSSRYARHAAGILLGSGTQGSALLHALCANPACDMDAELECSCGLVSYCSAKCRIFHANVHSKDCTLKASPPLQPRGPMSSGSSSSIFIWGNVPSISLAAKKSLLPEDELRLCFAASGDLRDFFATLASIPDDYSAKVSILINDFNSQIVVRNFLMLELLRLHGHDAIDAVIGLWYSSAMTDPQSLLVQAAAFDAMERSGYLDRSARTVAEARTLSDETGPPLRAPFARGRSTLTIGMSDSTWGLMFRLLHADASLRPDEVVAIQTRGRVEVLRLLLQNLWYLPSHMTARRAFTCETGLMLPFSMMRAGLQFGVGNQFLLYPPSNCIRPGQRLDFDWQQHPFADPLSGWEIKDVIEAGKRHGVPSKDLYGALFFHVRDVIGAAVRTLERCEVEIEMRDIDARKLTKEISTKFHAISTSNIADVNYVGFRTVLEDWGRGHLVAKGGTLVTLTMQWFVSNPEDACKYTNVLKAVGIRGEKEAVKVVRRALEKCVPKLKQTETGSVTVNATAPFFMRTDLAFRKGMERLGVFAAARRLGLRPRKQHQLVPRRVAVPVEAEQEAYPAEFATAEELLYHSISARSYVDRYIEWEVDDKPKNK